MAFSKKIKSITTEKCCLIMEISMKECGKMEQWMDLEFINGPMDVSIKDIFITERKMEKESIKI